MENKKGQLGWLIYKEEDLVRNQAFIRLLQEASELNNLSLTLKTREELQWIIKNGASPFSADEQPQFVINRSVSPWLNELCELFGIPVFNSALVARIANDKRLAHAYARSKHVPALETISISNRELGHGKSPLPFPYVVKDPYSRGGKAVFKVKNEGELSATLTILPDELIIQPLAGQIGKDLRVYVVGNEIIAAVLRQSTHEDEFRANISVGGKSSLYQLSTLERSMVLKLTEDIQLDFVGLDFLFSENGQLLFNEMEDAVGCRSLYMNSHLNIGDIFIQHMAKSLKKMK